MAMNPSLKDTLSCLQQQDDHFAKPSSAKFIVISSFGTKLIGPLFMLCHPYPKDAPTNSFLRHDYEFAAYRMTIKHAHHRLARPDSV
jgi:hypothetical protein